MNDLLQKLESYNWTDELGHPLVNCVEWIELKKLIIKHEMEKFHQLFDWALEGISIPDTPEIRKWRDDNKKK